MFIAPMNAPGVKLFCRTSYEMMANTIGTPFDYPLSLALRRERRDLRVR